MPGIPPREVPRGTCAHCPLSTKIDSKNDQRRCGFHTNSEPLSRCSLLDKSETQSRTMLAVEHHVKKQSPMLCWRRLAKPTLSHLVGEKVFYSGIKRCPGQTPSNSVELWFLTTQPDKMPFVLPSAKNSTCVGVTGVETGYCVS